MFVMFVLSALGLGLAYSGENYAAMAVFAFAYHVYSMEKVGELLSDVQERLQKATTPIGRPD